MTVHHVSVSPTRRQIDRAVNAALGRILPRMVRALRDDLVTTLREEFAAREAAPAMVQKPEPFWPASEMLRAAPPVPTPPEAVPTIHPPAGCWTVGEGSRRRLTEAGLARVAALLAEGKTDTQISVEMGITRRAVELRRKNGTESAAAWAATPQPERDLERAERNRQYQREWYRKRRAKGGTHGEAEPVVIGVDHATQPDVTVVAPAPPPPSVLQMARVVPEVAARIAPPPPPVRAEATHHPHTPRQAVPMDPAQLEPVPASYEDALDWLFAELTRQKMPTAEIETRLAAMTTRQLLATCNAQRVKAGLSPYVLTERAA